MKSIFLIKTPLQLLNAIEARHHFNLDANDCILIIMGDRKSQPQILNLANKINEWSNVVILNDVNMFFGSPFNNSHNALWNLQQLNVFKKSFFYIRRLNKISRYLGSVKYIFAGYTKYVYMSHFINITPHERLFFLDDGNGTIELAKQRKQGLIAAPDFSVRKKIKLIGKKYIQGIKDKEKESACFFTAYDISINDNDQIVRNDFKYLRSAVNDLPVSDVAYFIGSPLSEVAIMSQEVYLAQLNKVKEYFGNTELVYIAHRRDSSDKLDFIKNDLGIKVVLFDYPIEYQLAFIGPRPKVLASFFSAALDSCRLIFGNKLKIISFKLDMTDSPKREKIESIYASYETSVNDDFIIEADY
ncbi:MAG: alpha-2,8-polysialyltransferase family protein [Gammaproteobacteria bacterium]|nr:alpha-2,8-polysialyltransferase family protein [Gammaproteobacteria bacterium]